MYSLVKKRRKKEKKWKIKVKNQTLAEWTFSLVFNFLEKFTNTEGKLLEGKL